MTSCAPMKCYFPVRPAIVCCFLSVVYGSLNGNCLEANNSEFGYRLTLSPDFLERPDLKGMAPDVIVVYEYGKSQPGTLPVLFILERMRGVIGRESLTPENMPAKFKSQKFSFFKAKWMNFEVDAFETYQVVDNLNAVIYNVQIPIKREAIQLKLFGPAERSLELKKMLPELVAGFHGESNWLESGPSEPSKLNPFMLLMVVVIFAVGGSVFLWMVSRSHCEAGFFISIALMFVGYSAREVQIREVRLVAAIMQLMGFSGAIISIYYIQTLLSKITLVSRKTH